MRTERGQDGIATVNFEIAPDFNIEITDEELDVLANHPDTIEARVLAYCLYNQALFERSEEFIEVQTAYSEARTAADEAADVYDSVQGAIRRREIERGVAQTIIDQYYDTGDALAQFDENEIRIRHAENYPALRRLAVEMFRTTEGTPIAHGEVLPQVQDGPAVALATVTHFLEIARAPELVDDPSGEDLTERTLRGAIRTNWPEIVGTELAGSEEFMTKVYDSLGAFVKKFTPLQIYKSGRRIEYERVIDAFDQVSVQDAIEAFSRVGTDRIRFLLAFAAYRGTGTFIHPEDERIEEMEMEIRERYSADGRDSDFACASIVEITEAILNPDRTVTQVIARVLAGEDERKPTGDAEEGAIAMVQGILHDLLREAAERNLALTRDGEINDAQLVKAFGRFNGTNLRKLGLEGGSGKNGKYTLRDILIIYGAYGEKNKRERDELIRKIKQYYDDAI